MARNKPRIFFPGWRVSPSGERALFQRAEDVPPRWYREGDDPRHGAGAVSPGEAAEAPSPAGPAHPPEPAVPADDKAARVREANRLRAAANRAKAKAARA